MEINSVFIVSTDFLFLPQTDAHMLRLMLKAGIRT